MNKRTQTLYLLTLCTAISLPLEAVDLRSWLANMYHRHFAPRSTAFKFLAPGSLIGLCALAYYKHTINQQIIKKQNTQQRILASLNDYQNNQLQQLFNQNSPDLNSALPYIEVLLQMPLRLVIPEKILDQNDNNLPQVFNDYHLTTAASNIRLEKRWQNQWGTDTWNYALHRVKERNRYTYIEDSIRRNTPLLFIDNIPPLLAQSKELLKACLAADDLEVTNKEYNLITQHGGIDQIMTYIILKKFITQNNLSNISIPFHFLTLTEYERKIDSHQEATNTIDQHINIMVTSPYEGLECLSPNFIYDDMSKKGSTKNYTASILIQNIEKQPSNQPNDQTKEQLATLAAIFKITNENTVYDKDGNAIIIDTNKTYLQSLKSKLKQLSQEQKPSLKQASQEAAARQDAQIAEAAKRARDEKEKIEEKIRATVAKAKNQQLQEQHLKAEGSRPPSPQPSPPIQPHQKLKEQEKEEDIANRLINLIPTLETIAKESFNENTMNTAAIAKDQINNILKNSGSATLSHPLRNAMASFVKLKTPHNQVRQESAQRILKELFRYQAQILKNEIDNIFAPQLHALEQEKRSQNTDEALTQITTFLQKNSESVADANLHSELLRSLQEKKESATPVQSAEDIVNTLYKIYSIPQ